MACPRHDQDARHARELGLDKDDYRKKRFELTCYFDDQFLDGAAAQRPIGYLVNPPDDVKVAKSLDAGTEDNPPRPETYIMVLGTRDAIKLKESQITLLINELEFYVQGVGSPALGKRACCIRQSAADAARIKKIDEAVAGSWDIERSTRRRDAQRRYILTYEDCQNVHKLVADWQFNIDNARNPIPFLQAPPVASGPDYDIPVDFMIRVGATSTPRQLRRQYEQHLGDEQLCYLLDAVCKVLFPDSDIGMHYFTLRLIHRPELMEMAMSIDNAAIHPWLPCPTTKQVELVGPATPADFDRNFEEVMHFGVMMEEMSSQTNNARKQIKKARLRKAEHASWHGLLDAEEELSVKERAVIQTLEG
ncbi:hypothetical protein C1H76_5741 [Elsinoe australis]|uniref:Uncharacterized protein n=1 Tax=Elsinoe australis TaxID=40998 RepID=A0A4U7AUI7_9PEZI|nr:hypothetical protein C1H76_5741 [Elsinoe australis]